MESEFTSSHVRFLKSCMIFFYFMMAVSSKSVKRKHETVSYSDNELLRRLDMMILKKNYFTGNLATSDIKRNREKIVSSTEQNSSLHRTIKTSW